MKIAFISVIPVVPAREGNSSRILNLARAIRELGHEIYFIHLPSNLTAMTDMEGHRKEFGSNRFFILERTAVERGLYYAKRLAFEMRRRLFKSSKSDLRYYFGLDEFFGVGFRRKLKALHEKHDFDAALCAYVFQSATLTSFPPSVLKILDTHDAFADRHKLYGDDSYWYSIPVSEENRGFRRADVVIAIQDEEAGRFRQQLGGDKPEVGVVSHFIDLSRRVENYGSRNAVFVGSGNSANVVSLNYFTSKVLPIIVKALPDFRLVVAGSVGKAIADHPNIDKIGFVDHISDAFRSAQISVNPTLVGTGINIKLLDAMAAGVVTVATRTGMRGLGEAFQAGVIAVPDDSPEAFAQAIIDLASSEERRAAEGEKAYQSAVAWNAAQMTSLDTLLKTPHPARH